MKNIIAFLAVLAFFVIPGSAFANSDICSRIDGSQIYGWRDTPNKAGDHWFLIGAVVNASYDASIVNVSTSTNSSGNLLNPSSILNKNGIYGSATSTNSAFNVNATYPPLLVNMNGNWEHLTTNASIEGAVDPSIVLYCAFESHLRISGSI